MKIWKNLSKSQILRKKSYDADSYDAGSYDARLRK